MMSKHQPFEYDLTSETMRRFRESPDSCRFFDGPWESKRSSASHSFKEEVCVCVTLIGSAVIGIACSVLGVSAPFGIAAIVLAWLVIMVAVYRLWIRK